MTEPQEPRSTTPQHLTPEELSECAFSPQTAAAGWLEHAQGCAACSAELADLRLVLLQLAELPEPELPESVGIRLDAALDRAWQEADAEREAAAKASAGARSRARRSWRKIAIPVGSLALIVLAVIGIAGLLHNDDGGSSSSASAGTAQPGAVTNSNGSVMTSDTALAQLVRSVLPSATGAGAANTKAPLLETARCASVPQRVGYTVLTTAEREFEGVPATLVVYQQTQEPSSNTVYAVVYKGSCGSSAGDILAQGLVSR